VESTTRYFTGVMRAESGTGKTGCDAVANAGLIDSMHGVDWHRNGLEVV